jgi:AcrR family transcriptional regulator
MPRPRKASDDEVLAAAHRVMARLPPWEFTLGEIAREAGLTAGALVQRFGSKRGLLLRLMEAWSGGARQTLERLRAASASPLAAVFEWGDCLAGMGESPGDMAHHLAWLQQDMADPSFRRHVRTQTRETTAILRGWLDEAVAAGELSNQADTAALARAVQAMSGGSLIAWAFTPQGTARTWVRRDLEVLLRPWMAMRSGGRPTAVRSRRRRRRRADRPRGWPAGRRRR